MIIIFSIEYVYYFEFENFYGIAPGVIEQNCNLMEILRVI